LGHLGIQFAKAKGLKVLGVDAREDGIALSKEAGADCVLDARKGRDEVAQEALRVTGGKGVAATINVSDAKLAASTACAITQMHGTVIQVALVSSIYGVHDDSVSNCAYFPAPRRCHSVQRIYIPRYTGARFFYLLTEGGGRNAPARRKA
jgi:NADPH:quinone reductase-like Zn-dependent oxidoreductase